jgi:predicted RecB family nuclease
VPVSGLKTITDLVDSDVPTPEQFSANLNTAAASLQRSALALIEFLGAQA